MTGSLDRIEAAVSGWLKETVDRPLIVGLCGAQGSGKSTLAEGLRARTASRGKRAAILSLDDLYLSAADRAALARDVHPLLATRGVPLTHDVAGGSALLAAAKAGRPVRLPRFDKARDDPLPAANWPVTEPQLDLLIFEGWCVGARPQAPCDLAEPVNALEREADADGRWRRAVNDALAGPYAALFGAIDRLVMLAAPGFEVVARWRLQQEQALRRTLAADGRDTAGLMDAEGIARFVQHYERLTRWVLADMPARADLVLRLDAERQVVD